MSFSSHGKIATSPDSHVKSLVMAACIGAKVGDIIMFKRDVYRHYGIYLGDGLVGHVDFGEEKSKATKRKDYLVDISRGSKCMVKNSDYKTQKGRKLVPRSPEEVIEAFETTESKVDYHLVENNCEHYAHLWRYGVAFSGQVVHQFTVKQASVATGIVAGTAAIVGLITGVLVSTIRSSR